MTDENFNRRLSDAQASGAVAALQAEIRLMTGGVSKLTDEVRENSRQLARLSVLEASHQTHEAALGRAFRDINRVEGEAKLHEENQVKANNRYDRIISFMFGASVAISIVWSIVGYRINENIDSVMKTAADMRVHMQESDGHTHARAAGGG